MIGAGTEKEIVVGHAQDLERQGRMHIFQHRIVVIPLDTIKSFVITNFN